MMQLPNVIGPINAKGDTLSGIINEIVNTYGVSNPIDCGVVIPSSSITTEGDVKDTILWSSTRWRTYLVDGSDVFLQLMFPGRFLFPTAYSLRGIIPANTHCFSRKWAVYGFNEGEESDTNKWDNLAENASSERSFCGGGKYCMNTNIYTYTLKPSNRGYKYIRWKSLEGSCDNNYNHFATSAVEVYGTLSTTYSIRRSRKKGSCRQLLIYSRNSFSTFAFILVGLSY